MSRKIFILWLILLTFSSLHAQITGVVLDKKDSSPLPGCYIFITELQQATVSDSLGRFSFYNIPAGQFKVEFKLIGYETVIQDIRVETDQKLHLKIYMEPQPLRTPEVVVTAFIPSSQHNSAVTIQTIDFDSKVNYSAPSVLSVLRQEPGVDVISKGASVGQPVIRGLSKTNIVVLNNGFRMENFQFSENHPFLLDDFGVDKIEIVKGPASLLYGSDAVGGVINVLWEKPAPVNSFQTGFEAQYHSNSRAFLSSYWSKFSKNKFSLGLRAGQTSAADLTDAKGVQIVNSRFNKQFVKSFAFYNSSKVSLKFFAEGSKQNLGLPVSVAKDFVTDDSKSLYAFYQQLSHFFAGNKNTFFTGEKSKIKANWSYEENRRALKVSRDLPPGVDMLLRSFTYDLRYVTNKSRMTFMFGSQGDIVSNKNYGPSAFLPDYKKENFSFFALNKFIAGKVNFLAGVRFDNTALKMTQISQLHSGDTLLHYSSLSGSLGATVFLSNSLIIRLNFASAFRNPNAAELGESGIHGYRYESGNPLLKSQRSYETDLSIHFHKKHFLFDFSAFANRINNYIFLSPTNLYTADSLKIYTYAQTNALLSGFETGFRYKPVQSIEINGSYNYIYTSTDDGESLPLIPQNKLRAGVGFHPFKSLEYKLSTVYAFAMSRVAPQESPADAYFVVNTGVSYKFPWSNKAFVSIDITNLFNTTYQDHISGLSDAGYYDPGRSVILGLKYCFTKRLR